MNEPKLNQYDDCFQDLMNIIHEQRELIEDLAGYIERLQIGGGGTARLIDQTFTSNGTYRAADFNADGFRTVTVETQGGGGGIEPYEEGETYHLYDTVVEPETQVVYMVTVEEVTATDIKSDVEAGKLKLLGFDSQIVPFDHPPTKEEINNLPENCLVVEFNPNDTPYTGILSDNTNN